jgi:hypothetical protein
MDHPLPWLRYLDADDLDDETIDFDGLKVRNSQMETLGKVEGFIVDSTSARPYYVVVDSGGWFKSKHYLLPVGLAKIDDDNDALVVELSKERINRFPGFDKDVFEKMSEEDIRTFNNETYSATTDTPQTYSATEDTSAQWSRAYYAMPAWWSGSAEFLDPSSQTAVSAGAEYPPSKVAPVSTGSTIGTSQSAEQATAKADTGDVSPFFDGRAQPGDVLGLDTGGERTYVGETAEDENKRRQAAEEAVKSEPVKKG